MLPPSRKPEQMLPERVARPTGKNSARDQMRKWSFMHLASHATTSGWPQRCLSPRSAYLMTQRTGQPVCGAKREQRFL